MDRRADTQIRRSVDTHRARLLSEGPIRRLSRARGRRFSKHPPFHQQLGKSLENCAKKLAARPNLGTFRNTNGPGWARKRDEKSHGAHIARLETQPG